MKHSLPILTLLFACQGTVHSGLTERDADEIVVALQLAGVGASKEADPGGETFRVTTPEGDLGSALVALQTAGLPRRSQRGFHDVFESGSLLPSASEDDMRQLAASAGELATTLESVDGIFTARVHLAPTAQQGALDAPTAPGRAAVLIRHRSGTPPISEANVRTLIAGSVAGVSEESVSVVFVPVSARTSSAPALVSIGPAAVSAGSATLVRSMLFGLLLLNVLLAIGMVVLWRRRPE